jgi:hypothetical protein
MVVAQVRFARGSALPIHRHRASQAGYVLEGRLLITLPDEQLTVTAGQCFMLPAGVPHQVRATAKSVVLDLYSPGADVASAEITAIVRGVDDLPEDRPSATARAFPTSPRRSTRRTRRPAPGACPTLARSGDAA